ncbi:MAG TPA: hypothetical protein VKT72_04260 [Candidatus Baltobacteraceae bacterium]|nr:hypothetical protein [Candidatus Baltobacteraceae bacterium]
MDALERIRSAIAGFAGYDDVSRRRASDEQIRAFVGEVLAELPALEIDNLTAEDRACYDRVLLRCEFINQHVFRLFDTDPTPQRIEATLRADVLVVEAACALRAQTGGKPDGVLAALSEAFDKRDAAMQLA